MSDPISYIAIGAAIGGAAGKFVEKSWDTGEKWLSSFFKNHQQKAKDKAYENSKSFLNELAKRVEELEKKEVVDSKQIEEAQDHPDFSVILQKAILSSSQTDDKGKHLLLARLVSERLKAKSDSVLSLASKMACDAISFATKQQLDLLGLITNVFYIQPSNPLSEQDYSVWLLTRLSNYMNLKITNLDYLHLEAISCLKFEPVLSKGDLITLLSKKNAGIFNKNEFANHLIGKSLSSLWKENKMSSISLTSVGQIIGVYVSDMYTNGKTNFVDWY